MNGALTGPQLTERAVPNVLMLFTGLVVMGVMINVTVAIPTASLVGTSLLDAAFVISSYSVRYIHTYKQKCIHANMYTEICTYTSTSTVFLGGGGLHSSARLGGGGVGVVVWG